MIKYEEDFIFALIPRLSGSVFPRALIFAIPAALACSALQLLNKFIPGFLETVEIAGLDKSVLWSMCYGVLATLLGFRTNRAMARFWEGTGLLHQMRGEWFDSISCCVTFSTGAVRAKPVEVKKFRHTIVRLMSLCHGSAISEIACEDLNNVAMIDTCGLSNETLNHLQSCKEDHNFNRVEVVLHMIQTLITKSLADGVLQIPPPILSRVYQTLSRGFVNLLNAKKIADTRFPFPFAQLISTLLLFHSLWIPMLIASTIESLVWGPLFAFLPTFAMYSLNFIGVELENPFGSDENDLPLDHFQHEMNSCLLMLLHPKTDLIAGVDPERCQFDFAILESEVQHSEEEKHEALEAGGHSEPGRRNPRLTDFTKSLRAESPLQERLSIESLAIAQAGAAPSQDTGRPKAEAAPKAAPAPPPPPQPTNPAAGTSGAMKVELSSSDIEKSMRELSGRIRQFNEHADVQAQALAQNTRVLSKFSQALFGVTDVADSTWKSKRDGLTPSYPSTPTARTGTVDPIETSPGTAGCVALNGIIGDEPPPPRVKNSC